jgi:hypothetical protein
MFFSVIHRYLVVDPRILDGAVDITQFPSINYQHSAVDRGQRDMFKEIKLLCGFGFLSWAARRLLEAPFGHRE